MRMSSKWHRVASVGVALVVAAVGCGGNAQVELAASDALLTVADHVRLAVDEYHAEIGRLDDEREGAVVFAFVDRVRADVADEAVVDGHVAAFRSAMGKLRGDREVEWTRHRAAIGHAAVIKEVAAGLRQMAIESLSLEDEMRRYFTSWIEASRSASEEVGVRIEN